MQSSKEIRCWINKRRKRDGKKNGVIRWLWDDYRMDLKDGNSKKCYDRKDKRLPGT